MHGLKCTEYILCSFSTLEAIMAGLIKVHVHVNGGLGYIYIYITINSNNHTAINLEVVLRQTVP